MVRHEPTELSSLARDLWRRAAPSLLDASRVLVALSGGLDSSVLLALLVELRNAGELLPPLEAIHVHHGLQDAADAWERHCRELCRTSEVPLYVARAQVDLEVGGSGLEAAAREARYAAFAEHLPRSAVLLQAHHADDQCETLLLHLLRGSGPRGLAGIPAARPLAQGQLLRPLLHCARSELLQYAQVRGLRWVEDPSNTETALDRNYLRHRVLPQLCERWPSLVKGLGRSSELLADASDLLDALAAIDLERARRTSPHRLDVTVLSGLPVSRRHNLLRYWIRQVRGEGARIPGSVLNAGLADLLAAAEDRMPLVAWDSGVGRLELRRHRNELYLLDTCSAAVLPDLDWVPARPLQLPGRLGSLELITDGDFPLRDLRLEVRWRRGGERMQLAQRGTHTLKNLLQEAGVPAWQRSRLPLVYGAGELLVVPGLFESAAWPAFIGSQDARIVWHDADLH